MEELINNIKILKSWRRWKIVKPIRYVYWLIKNTPLYLRIFKDRFFLYLKRFLKAILPRYTYLVLASFYKKIFFKFKKSKIKLYYSKKRNKKISLKRRIFLEKLEMKKNIALYLSSQGNYFFKEIAGLLYSGIASLGYSVKIYNEKEAWAKEADWHIIIAPQEFFHSSQGQYLLNKKIPINNIMIQAEQPDSAWFHHVIPLLEKAYAIWDIDFSSYSTIKRFYPYVSYLTLGYTKSFDLSKVGEIMPTNINTCFIDKKIRDKPFKNLPFKERPIDICFYGHSNERRELFFNKHAKIFSKYKCYFFFSDPSKIVIEGENGNLDTQTTMSILQRSKLVLNIHHGDNKYFEWHRIVTHGVTNKNLVLTEPVTQGPPFLPGQDFVVCHNDDEWEENIKFFLETEEGRIKAQDIIESAHKKLLEDCRIDKKIKNLMDELLTW